MSQQNTEFQPAASECCLIDFTDAFVEYRSVRLDRIFYSNPAALAAYNSEDISAYAWGVYKEILFDGVNWTAQVIVSSSATSVNFPNPGGSFISKFQYHWKVTVREGQEWREMDGPGIKVKWAIEQKDYTYNPATPAYESPVTSYDNQEEDIIVNEGDIEVTGATHDMEAAAAQSLHPVGAQLPALYLVEDIVVGEDPEGQGFSGGYPFMFGVTRLNRFYAQKRGGTSTDLELNFLLTGTLPNADIFWTERAVDMEGNVVSEVTNGITIPSGLSTTTISAPAVDGRNYVFKFGCTTLETAKFPIIRPLQECISLP